LGVGIVAAVLTVFCMAGMVHGDTTCRHNNGISYRNGEEWEERGAFIMRCTVFHNGSWKTEVVACVQPNTQRRISLNRTVVDGNDEWRCEMNGNGMVSLVQSPNPRATCDGHSVGSRWQEKSFELECKPGGYRKLVACVTEEGEKIPVNGSKEVNGFQLACQQYNNGTVVFHGQKSVKPEQKPWSSSSTGNSQPAQSINSRNTYRCVDEQGTQRDVGAHWIENHRFNKTCKANGAVEVVNCISKDGYRVPLNGQLVKEGSKYTCEMTPQGTIRYASGPLTD